MPVYLDHNATTALAPEVLDAMLPYLRRPYGNPSSVHRYGRAARDAIERARAQLAALVNCQPAEIIWTSGGSEANNLALRGVSALQSGRRLLYGSTEHPAVLETAEALARQGRADCDRCQGTATAAVPVDNNGLVDQQALSELAAATPLTLISLMRANNETGVIQDLAPAVDAARQHQALVHSDCVQALGKMPLDFAAMNLDLMSLSAHKIFGPKGAGALVLRGGVDLQPQIAGGGQERGLRGGTENLPAIVGFGAAAERAQSQLESWTQQCGALRQQLEQGLAQLEGVVIHAQTVARLANTCQFSVPGYDGETLTMALDRHGLAVSSGSACSSGKGQPSHVLLAMGVPEALAQSAVRVSFGPDNGAEDVEQLLAALRELRPGRAVA